MITDIDLLGEILGEYVSTVSEIDSIVMINKEQYSTTNIYELAHKYKEWAKDNGWWVDTNLGFASIGKNGTKTVWKCFNGYDLKLDEPGLTIQSCEWIKKEGLR